MFSARRTPEPISSASAPQSKEAADQRVLAAIEQLLANRFTSAPQAEGRAGELLAKIATSVRQSNTSQLSAVRGLGVDVCEAAINLGWLSHDFREVAQSTVSISSAVEELAASISQVSTATSDSAVQSESARDMMRGCIKDSRAAVEAMTTIEQRARLIGERVAVLQSAVDQIGEMTTSIDTIARQTNLLALNATIEAARAGEAGRGFAVVAAEVKSLSLETGKATQEIRTRVEALTRGVHEISTAMQESLRSVGTGTEIVTQVGTIVESIGDEVSSVAERIRSLAEVLDQQRTVTTEITQSVVRISEKAAKSRDEVENITKRLLVSERNLADIFDNAKDRPVDNLPLIRFAADMSMFKRQLGVILLGGAPATMPVFPGNKTSAFAQELLAARKADPGLAARFAEQIRAIEQNAKTMVEKVAQQNWGEATPAYIACDEGLKEAIITAGKIEAGTQ